jgi:hypothetical protein
MIHALLIKIHQNLEMHLIGIGGTFTLLAVIKDHTQEAVSRNVWLGTISLLLSILVTLRKAYKEDRRIIIKYCVDIPTKHYRYFLVKIRVCKDYIFNIKKKQ